MADTWVTDITHFLDDNGEMIVEPVQARKLAEYFAAIVMLASHPDVDNPQGYEVKCRRNPNRKPCKEMIACWIEPENDNIFWICPKCQDRGTISNWRGTMWDMSDLEEIFH